MPLVLVIFRVFCWVTFSAIYFYPRVWKLKKEYKQAVKSGKKLETQAGGIPETKKPGRKGLNWTWMMKKMKMGIFQGVEMDSK
jgi:hypothetical protein